MPEFDCGYKNDASATIMVNTDLEENTSWGIYMLDFLQKKKKINK